MIIIEITDETGITHYEILSLSLESLADLDDKGLAKVVRTAAKKAKGEYNKAAQRGDKVAEEKVNRINQAETTLKAPDTRKQYDDKLESGSTSNLDVLRIQQIAPSFFWDRNMRFRLIERLMQEEGLVNVPMSFDL